VLLLHGDRDTTAPLDGVRRLMRGRPAWQLAVRPAGDHHLFLREPAWVLTRIRQFVALRRGTMPIVPGA
jgi:hypothetical protein